MRSLVLVGAHDNIWPFQIQVYGKFILCWFNDVLVNYLVWCLCIGLFLPLHYLHPWLYAVGGDSGTVLFCLSVWQSSCYLVENACKFH